MIERIGDATLYLGDCLEILPTLDRVDAVVTDPPYGIGVDKSMHKQSGNVVGHGHRRVAKRVYEHSEWDNGIVPEFLPLIEDVPERIIFGGNYYELPPSRCWLVWDKENGSNNFSDCELAWTNINGTVRIKHHLWNGMARQKSELRHDHPTQKPVTVMEWCVRQCKKDPQTILDPFMGSGTTGVACANLGRKFIGIEIEEKYFQIACERITAAYAQGRLFA